jgi:hypothetical protein
MRAEKILETIGGTPHVRINRLYPSRVEVWMKLERANPGGSIKDRIARYRTARGVIGAGTSGATRSTPQGSPPDSATRPERADGHALVVGGSRQPRRGSKAVAEATAKAEHLAIQP